MRLDQQFKVWPKNLAHPPDVVDGNVFVGALDRIAARTGERVPFCCGESLFLQGQRAFQIFLQWRGTLRPAIGINPHPLTRRAAQQIIDRQAGVFAQNVPQRDFDRAPGRQQFQRAAAGSEIVVDDLRGVTDVESAAADHVRRHGAQAAIDHLVASSGHVGLTPAVQAAFRFHAAEQQVLAGAWRKDKSFDACDFHDALRFRTAGGSGIGSIGPMTKT